jgi:hypothetical protein
MFRSGDRLRNCGMGFHPREGNLIQTEQGENINIAILFMEWLMCQLLQYQVEPEMPPERAVTKGLQEPAFPARRQPGFGWIKSRGQRTAADQHLTKNFCRDFSDIQSVSKFRLLPEKRVANPSGQGNAQGWFAGNRQQTGLLLVKKVLPHQSSFRAGTRNPASKDGESFTSL